MYLFDIPLNDGSLHPKDPSSLCCFAHSHADSSLCRCRLLYGNYFFFTGLTQKWMFKKKTHLGLDQVMIVAKNRSLVIKVLYQFRASLAWLPFFIL